MTILGHVPSKANCYKVITQFGHGGLAKQKVLKEYEKSFFIQCPHRDAMIEGYFNIECDVFYETQRADLDNALKITLDCLQMCKVIKNDNRCVEIHSRKFIDKTNPRIVIKLTTVDI